MTKIAGSSFASSPVPSQRQARSTAPDPQPHFTRGAGPQPDGMKRNSSEIANPTGSNKRSRGYDPRTTLALNPFYDHSLDQYLGLQPAPQAGPAPNPSHAPGLGRYPGGNPTPGR